LRSLHTTRPSSASDSRTATDYRAVVRKSFADDYKSLFTGEKGVLCIENRQIKTIPIISALIIACVGAVICYNSLA